MTVKELIEKLKNFPQDMKVGFWDGDGAVENGFRTADRVGESYTLYYRLGNEMEPFICYLEEGSCDGPEMLIL